MRIFEDFLQLLTFGQFGIAQHSLRGTEFEIGKFRE